MIRNSYALKATLSALFIAIGVIIATPAQTHAADTPQLSASITSNDPLQSTLTLKNISNTACQIAETSTGTVAITKVVQNGKEINAEPLETSFEDNLDTALLSTLKTLQPGESSQILLRASKSGDTIGLRPVTWSPDAGTLGFLYIVEPNQPLQLELNYLVPIESPDDTPICKGIHATTIQQATWLRPLLITLASIAVIIVAIILWRLTRKRKQPVIVAGFALMSISAAFGISQPVSAQVDVPSSVQSNWNSCVATLRANSDITGPVLNLIDNPAVHIVIDPITRGGTEASSPWPDGTYHIDWNYNDRHAYAGGGGNADPCTSIYHELYHILDMENRTFSRDDCAGSGIETKEVMATREQNRLRARLGMPERTHYGDRPLPAGDCRAAPTPPPCRSATCGRSVGEPHLRTYDGHYYDFQAAGEFTLTRTKDKNFEVQVRQQQWQDSKWVAINTAASIKTAEHIIEVFPNGSTLGVRIDGKAAETKATELSGGDVITRPDVNNRIDVTTKDGTTVTVTRIANYGVDVVVDPSDEMKGKLEGLLGDFDGETKNDLRLQDGSESIDSNFEQLYPRFSDSWRLTDQSSHFTYAEGKATASYTDRAFPYERFDPKALSGYAAAEEFCKQRGVTDQASLSACAMDVALTGRPEFAKSAMQHQVTTIRGDTNAASYTLTARNPGDLAKVTFTAKKDEKVFVDIYSSTLPAVCGAISIRDATDRELANGCVINGNGYIDTTTLPEEGTYSLQFKASDAAAGEARVRLYRVTDQTEPITLNGNPVTATIATPGMTARFNFTASAGQRVFINTSNVALSSQCSPLGLISPSGQSIGSGCIINNKGNIDTTVIPETGNYTLLINPSDVSTGKLTLLLTTSDMIKRTIQVGESTRLSFSKPGDEAEVSFRGTAGQRVFIDVANSTLPSQCGGFGLRMPGGEKRDGCIIGNSDSLEDAGTVLPATGLYAVFINPSEANTGELTLQIR